MLILLISYNQGWHTCSCLFSTCKNIPAPKEGVHINLGLRKKKRSGPKNVLDPARKEKVKVAL